MISGRFTVIGGGHGTAAVARALRGTAAELTLIVTTADDGGSSGVLRQRWGGPAVGDMRRSLIAVSGEDTLVGRTLAHPLTLDRLGTHPLGNLLLHSLTGAFGDLATAAHWLEQQIGIAAEVLPASYEPISLLALTGEDTWIRGESAIGASIAQIRRLCFEPRCPSSPRAAVAAIERADAVLIAPGSLFTSTLAAVALPDLAAALSITPATIVWLCNLVPDAGEAAGMGAAEHLAALRSHGVRIDAVVYDPEAQLHLTASELAGEELYALARRLRKRRPDAHDPDLLRGALDDLLDSRLIAAA